MEIAMMAATSRMVCQRGAIAGGVAGAGGVGRVGSIKSYSGAGKGFLFDRITEGENAGIENWRENETRVWWS